MCGVIAVGGCTNSRISKFSLFLFLFACGCGRWLLASGRIAANETTRMIPAEVLTSRISCQWPSHNRTITYNCCKRIPARGLIQSNIYESTPMQVPSASHPQPWKYWVVTGWNIARANIKALVLQPLPCLGNSGGGAICVFGSGFSRIFVKSMASQGVPFVLQCHGEILIMFGISEISVARLFDIWFTSHCRSPGTFCHTWNWDIAVTMQPVT